MTQVINISAYKFVTLNNLEPLRSKLKSTCLKLGLKGTILLSPEGINVTLAGARSSIDAIIAYFENEPLFKNMPFKESLSDHQPFNRMLVRLKKEVIAFGVPEIRPQVYTSPHLKPSVLRDWLESGKEVVLLDTRNEYEIKLGTFKNAINPHIDSFRDFPEAVKKLDPSLKEKPIVTFCTGGVRCEKAAPHLENEGFKEVYQIDGGILKYFEECGDAFWEGDCFVFDHRVALNPSLEQTKARLCFRCRSPLTEEDYASAAYVIDVSCPYCIGTESKQNPLSESLS
ncbi:MAG: sulfurtransferase [Alphaproteobacteria bacterium RIFCSPLOWO2_01_FULL_45_8]|nr:MAG: sulfurtransferase [Alphaproteobacteria bacterium GWB1_45_5]OFW76209.1 MAG: sulfurtransferase [Alphaproteobacteria bacterium GWA1_45_9]OFW89522.1 MAG: sulfurtransferase [Alphaproteobacteria bacterium RIFCSPHIGHO2_01_FULL_41_14]OFW95648.1 MAG: sulfurtransferase [Alphaproteobacteria bacterium RIFCSPLOWO2_01_FULL_45_8]HCI48722.1 sulfurtransferase [Holosporales bacterium]